MADLTEGVDPCTMTGMSTSRTLNSTAAQVLAVLSDVGTELPHSFTTSDGYVLELGDDGWVFLTGPDGSGLGRFTNFEGALTVAVEHQISRPYWTAVETVKEAVVDIPGVGATSAYRVGLAAVDALVKRGYVTDRVRS